MLVALIAHPFMVFSYNHVYTTDWNGDHCYQMVYTGTPFFEQNGAYIFIIGLTIAAYFAFCIYNGIKMIQNNQVEKYSILNFKIPELTTFLGIMPLEAGGLIIGTLSVLLGIYLLCSLIATIPFDMLTIQDTLFLTSMFNLKIIEISNFNVF